VTLNDPLPSGSGVSWSISPAYSGPGTCSISVAVPRTLSCAFGNLNPGQSVSVHVTSATTAASAGTYANTATASATNASSAVQASATTTVKGALALLQELLAWEQVEKIGPGSSFIAKTQTSISSLQAGRVNDTCSSLTDIINEANAQSGKKLTKAQATFLINAATNVRTVLSCSKTSKAS
jgi:hypothetical protein